MVVRACSLVLDEAVEGEELDELEALELVYVDPTAPDQNQVVDTSGVGSVSCKAWKSPSSKASLTRATMGSYCQRCPRRAER